MEELEDCPVIAAVKDEKGLEECLNMDVGMVFVLYGTVCTIGEIVKRIKDQGKIAVVHIDLIQGLSGKDAAVEFLKTYTRADGIWPKRCGRACAPTSAKLRVIPRRKRSLRVLRPAPAARCG